MRWPHLTRFVWLRPCNDWCSFTTPGQTGQGGRVAQEAGGGQGRRQTASQAVMANHESEFVGNRQGGHMSPPPGRRDNLFGNSCVPLTRDSESSRSVHSGSERERPVYVRTPSDLTRNRDSGLLTALDANPYTPTGNRKTPGGRPLGVSRKLLCRPFPLPTRSAPRV